MALSTLVEGGLALHSSSRGEPRNVSVEHTAGGLALSILETHQCTGVGLPVDPKEVAHCGRRSIEVVNVGKSLVMIIDELRFLTAHGDCLRPDVRRCTSK